MRSPPSLSKHAAGERDPLWRMPLWEPYESMLDSKVADINNVGDRRLCRLDHLRAVSEEIRVRPESWLHFDIYGWNPASKPARPEGGECQAARAAYAYLCERYG